MSDAIGQAIARTEALLTAIELLVESAPWTSDFDSRRPDRISHLLDTALETVRATAHMHDRHAAR